MKTTKQNSTLVPNGTLKAIKSMLFSNCGEGIDLTNIVNDLITDEAGRDITAINVALAFKGVQIDINKSTRYTYSHSNYFNKMEYINYSIIMGVVAVKETYCRFENDTITPIREDIRSISLNDWETYSTNFEELKEKLISYK